MFNQNKIYFTSEVRCIICSSDLSNNNGKINYKHHITKIPTILRWRLLKHGNDYSNMNNKMHKKGK